ncbi:MAG: hypothetical protein Q6373_016955 [Candidatus Sigynarchaeota archaeon]
MVFGNLNQMFSWMKKGGLKETFRQTNVPEHEIDRLKVALATQEPPGGVPGGWELPFERLLDVFPLDADIYDILALGFEKRGKNRDMISANEMYARCKGDMFAAESLASVVDPAPPASAPIQVNSAFQLKRVLDRYHELPVVLAMETVTLDFFYGSPTDIAEKLSKHFHGRLQSCIVNLDMTHRIGAFFDVKVNQPNMIPITVLLVHKGRIVVDTRSFTSMPLDGPINEVKAYLEDGDISTETPRKFLTHEFLTFQWTHPAMDDPSIFTREYPTAHETGR